MTPSIVADPDLDPTTRTSRTRGRRSRGSRRSRRRIITLSVLGGMVAILTGTAVALYLTARTLPSTVTRIDGAFDGIPEEARPTKATQAKGSLTFMLVGTDSHAPVSGDEGNDAALSATGIRSDVMMLVHLPADRKSATLISLPRDSWVSLPGRGMGKLNWAYSYGGPSLLIQTMEQLTGIRVDHFAVVDFFGLRAIVESLNGVDVPIADDTVILGRAFPPGVSHLNGAQALAYVRERKSLPHGDLDRVKRQQNLIRAIVTRASGLNPMRDPRKTYDLVDSTLKAISVDDSLTDDKMRQLATSLIGVGGSDLSFLTAPVRGLGREGDQSVVYLDDTRGAPLWSAVRDDQLTAYLSEHRGDLLSGAPR